MSREQTIPDHVWEAARKQCADTGSQYAFASGYSYATSLAPTVSGGEGWEELDGLLSRLTATGPARAGCPPINPDGQEAADALRALIAVARGGFNALQASPSLPTVQAETAVVGWRAACREEANALFAEGRYNDANRFRQVMDDFGEEVMRRFARRLQQPPVSTGEQPGMSEGEAVAWRPMKDAPRDETDILLNHRVHGIIQGRFWPGSWTDDTPVSPREYEGDMWVLGDDLAREEVEFGPDGYENHGNVLGWAPIDHAAPTLPEDLLSLSEAATAGPWRIDNDFIETLDPVELEYERRAIADTRYFHLPLADTNAALIVASVNFIRTLAARQNRAGETT